MASRCVLFSASAFLSRLPYCWKHPLLCQVLNLSLFRSPINLPLALFLLFKSPPQSSVFLFIFLSLFSPLQIWMLSHYTVFSSFIFYLSLKTSPLPPDFSIIYLFLFSFKTSHTTPFSIAHLSFRKPSSLHSL